MADVQHGDVVVLLQDIPSDQLSAGMAGIVREVNSEDGGIDSLRVEFGEPQESTSVTVEVPRSAFRTPRPGGLIEGYQS